MTSPREEHPRYFETDHYLESPSKRRKITLPHGMLSAEGTDFADGSTAVQSSTTGIPNAGQDVCQDDHENISISASSKQAGQTVAPFLAKHIPEQYASGGGLDSSGNAKGKDPNTKYCYRHRPDLKCRRQANEPSMDQLQHVSSPVSSDRRNYAHYPQELEDLSQDDQQAIAHVWSLFSAAPAKHRNLMLQGKHGHLKPSVVLTCDTQVSSHNVAFHSCHICLLMSEILSESIFSLPYRLKYPTKFFAIWIRHLCARQPGSASDGGHSQMMMLYGTGCVSSILIGSVRNAAGVYHCWSVRGSGLRRDSFNSELLVGD